MENGGVEIQRAVSLATAAYEKYGGWRIREIFNEGTGEPAVYISHSETNLEAILSIKNVENKYFLEKFAARCDREFREDGGKHETF